MLDHYSCFSMSTEQRGSAELFVFDAKTGARVNSMVLATGWNAKEMYGEFDFSKSGDTMYYQTRAVTIQRFDDWIAGSFLV